MQKFSQNDGWSTMWVRQMRVIDVNVLKVCLSKFKETDSQADIRIEQRTGERRDNAQKHKHIKIVEI